MVDLSSGSMVQGVGFRGAARFFEKTGSRAWREIQGVCLEVQGTSQRLHDSSYNPLVRQSVRL